MASMEKPMCRLCLTPNSGTASLFDRFTMKPNVLLIQKVIECTSIRLTAEDDYPSSICPECESKLNELSAFKIQCIVNNDFYREKQAELRKRQLTYLLQQQQQQQLQEEQAEVISLDDDDDEDDEQEEEEQRTVAVNVRTNVGQNLKGFVRLPVTVERQEPARVAQVQQQVVKQQEQPPSKKIRIEQVIIEDDDDDDQEEEVAGLDQPTTEEEYDQIDFDDYKLVEGQEVVVDQFFQPLPEQADLDNNAILSSILLDDEDDEEDTSATTTSLLKVQHQQGHYEKDYPYECEYCRRRYSSLVRLESHVKAHSQNRMKCFICGKMVVVHLLRHLRSQHPGKPFPEPVRCWHNKCAQLEEVFYNVDQLLAHMDTKRRRR